MTAQNNVWMIPVNPTPTDTPAIDVLNQFGAIGVTITGAAFYNAYDGGGAPAPGGKAGKAGKRGKGNRKWTWKTGEP